MCEEAFCYLLTCSCVCLLILLLQGWSTIWIGRSLKMALTAQGQTRITSETPLVSSLYEMHFRLLAGIYTWCT